VYLVLPAEAREWARDNGIPQLPVSNQPSAISHQPPADSQALVRITRPDNGTIYRVTPQTPIETQQIPVQAIVADGVHLVRLTLLVDGQPIGEFTASPARAWWTLQPGAHRITALAIDQQGKEYKSVPVQFVVTQ
jgi:hypothetical protein